jgi:hypothetical protein
VFPRTPYGRLDRERDEIADSRRRIAIPDNSGPSGLPVGELDVDRTATSAKVERDKPRMAAIVARSPRSPRGVSEVLTGDGVACPLAVPQSIADPVRSCR